MRPVIQEIDDIIRATIFRKDSKHMISNDVTSTPISDLELKMNDLIDGEPHIKIP